MSDEKYLFTSESVTEGHPDKVADQISDAVLDEALRHDPMSRVACETMVSTGMVLMAGEITTKADLEYASIARRTIEEIGYSDPHYGFDFDNCSVLSSIDPQSPDIAMGVDTGGAGDQGLMFGFACRETEQLMPLPIMLAHGLTRRLADARRAGDVSHLRPDGKSQVTVEYGENNQPRRVHTVVVSTQHDPEISNEELRRNVIEGIIKPTIPKHLMDEKTILHVNPTGRFVVGGPKGDCGLTGRKIIVDTYGGVGSHGVACRRRAGRPSNGAARVCHWSCRSGLRSRQQLRHLTGRRSRPREGSPRSVSADTGRDHGVSRTATADLSPDRCVWSFRS
jgi:S-adenosylmethionine synthetase